MIQVLSSLANLGIEVIGLEGVIELHPTVRKRQDLTSLELCVTARRSVPKTIPPCSLLCLLVLIWTRRLSMRTSISAGVSTEVGLKYVAGLPTFISRYILLRICKALMIS